MSKQKQKKRTWLRVLLMIAGGLGIGGVLLALRQIGMLVVVMLFAGVLAASETCDLLLTSTSPGGEYVLEAYRENTPAIEPYYVRVDLVEGDERRSVYYVRGQDKAEVVWLTEDVARINGVPVDLSKGECFEANALGYFTVMVEVKAPDVQWLEMTVCMDGEPRLTKERTGVAIAEPVDGWGLSARLNVLQELHWDDDLKQKKAGLTVTAKSDDGQTITLPYLLEWTAKEYGSYTFTLHGSAEAGYTLTPENMKYTVTQMEAAYER